MDGLVICMNLKYHISHMLYGCTLSHCSDVPIVFMKVKYYPIAYNYTTVFSWVAS